MALAVAYQGQPREFGSLGSGNAERGELLLGLALSGGHMLLSLLLADAHLRYMFQQLFHEGRGRGGAAAYAEQGETK